MSLGFIIAISVIGTFMNSIGLIMQKQGVNKTGSAGFAYLKNGWWLMGLAI